MMSRVSLYSDNPPPRTGHFSLTWAISFYCVGSGGEVNGHISDLNIPGVSHTCSAATKALCTDMSPQLYLTYKNEGVCVGGGGGGGIVCVCSGLLC